MLAFSSYLHQNNQAVSMMDSREYDKAIKTLSNVFREMKEDLQLRGIECSDESGFTSLDQLMTDQFICGPNEGEADRHDLLFIYNKAILAPPAFVVRNSEKQPMVMFSSIVVFNLALAFQLSADACEVTKDGNLYRALQLYALAFRLQERESFGENALFALAILSNSGVIYHCMNKQVHSDKCFGQLLSILMLLKDSNETENIYSKLDLSGFHNNVHSTILCKAILAAAGSA